MPSPVRQAVGRQALSDRPAVRQAVGAVGCRPQAWYPITRLRIGQNLSRVMCVSNRQHIPYVGCCFPASKPLSYSYRLYVDARGSCSIAEGTKEVEYVKAYDD